MSVYRTEKMFCSELHLMHTNIIVGNQIPKIMVIFRNSIIDCSSYNSYKLELLQAKNLSHSNIFI